MERCIFDENQPKGAMSLNNLRNQFRALHQLDVMPLRARASFILDDMEYSTDAAAQNEWSGTGVTVTTNSVDKQEGNYCLQCVIDATGDRQVRRSQNMNLAGFIKVRLWERSSVVSSSIQFLLKDNLGNESYWNITTNSTPNTWQQDELDLLNPDGHSGSPADLSNIVEFGYKGLDVLTTYLFDTNKVICGKNVAVSPADIASFYKQVWVSDQPLSFTGGASPTISNPSAYPRIDILYIDSSATLSWVQGVEQASPVPNWANLPNNVIAICLVYCQPSMTRVVDYEDKDSFPNDGYIYTDCRPFLNNGMLKNKIRDANNDTIVEVEDADIIRFKSAGIERAHLDATSLDMAVDVDFNKKQAIELVIENRTSDPPNPVPGQIWFRTDV